MRPNHFYKVIRFGPVTVGSYSDGRGRTLHTAVCTAPRCDFSAEYRGRAAAELAARTHRCNPR
ncbi:mobile element transfer protein [Streptomyces sp. NPDC085540]|uniref:mobile element transfer protein n=1 Tax=Streptomyces sp. NPDC085540 TaxID=3365730 RepID=UPI0037D35CEA